MRPCVFRSALFLAAALLAPVGAAQAPACAPGTAEGTLQANAVRAQVFNTGSLFFGGSTTNGDGYLVPRAAVRSPVFAAGLWVGGRVNGEVRVAAARYADFNFWPGPLTADGSLPNPSSCAAYDRIYTVSQQDITAYDNGQPPTADLRDWPVALGAEVIDGDGVPGNYNLAGGDRPRLVGAQTAFWVMNDVGRAPHPGNGSAPLGIEVQVTAGAIMSSIPALNESTLYRFRIVKKSPGLLSDAYAGVFLDADLGNATDDYIGSDSTRALGYAYNADNEDEGPGGYGLAPPAVGIDLLSGASGYVPSSSVTSPPDALSVYYNLLRSLNPDGTPLVVGFPGGPTTRWIFAGDPVAGTFPNEIDNGTPTPNVPGDRRSLINAPRFALAQGDHVDVDVAVVYARGTDHLDSITRLRQASDIVQAVYDTGVVFPVAGSSGPDAPAAFALSAPRPNPSRGTAEVSLTTDAPGPARVAVVDVLGREVAVLLDAAVGSGTHVLRVAPGLPAGTYLVVATGTTGRATQRLTVVR